MLHKIILQVYDLIPVIVIVGFIITVMIEGRRVKKSKGPKSRYDY